MSDDAPMAKPMTVTRLVAKYELGAVSTHEFVVDCLNLVDPGEPSATLDYLPLDTLPELRKFLDSYRPGQMLSSQGGPIPTPDQVRAAKQWLDLLGMG